MVPRVVITSTGMRARVLQATQESTARQVRCSFHIFKLFLFQQPISLHTNAISEIGVKLSKSQSKFHKISSLQDYCAHLCSNPSPTPSVIGVKVETPSDQFRRENNILLYDTFEVIALMRTLLYCICYYTIIPACFLYGRGSWLRSAIEAVTMYLVVVIFRRYQWMRQQSMSKWCNVCGGRHQCVHVCLCLWIHGSQLWNRWHSELLRCKCELSMVIP